MVFLESPVLRESIIVLLALPVRGAKLVALVVAVTGGLVAIIIIFSHRVGGLAEVERGEILAIVASMAILVAMVKVVFVLVFRTVERVEMVVQEQILALA